MFLGWDRPGLLSACDVILGLSAAAAGEVDLRDVVIVTPGGRVGRNLRAMLIDRAGGPLVPPRMVTPGGLGRLLLDLVGGTGSELSRAGGMACRLAWAEALRAVPAEELEPLVPRPPRGDGVGVMGGWLAIGDMLARCHSELAGELMLFEDVPRRAREAGFLLPEEGRWVAAGRVQAEYREWLAARGLCDLDLEMVEVLGAGSHAVGLAPTSVARGSTEIAEPISVARVVLLGVAELNASARACLRRVVAAGGAVTALVFAPESMGERFDEFGCVRVDSWVAAGAELGEEQVLFADSPADQAERALEVIAGRGGELAADQVVIGAPDEGLVPFLERAAERVGGLKLRSAMGTAVSATGPWRLLAAVAEFVERRTLDSLRGLVRHPDLERWLAGELENSPQRHRGHRGGAGGEWWLSVMDDYAAESLHGEVTGTWFTDDPDVLAVLEGVHGAVMGLLSPLVSSELKPAQDWGIAILGVLERVYSRCRVGGHGDRGRLMLGAAQAVREALDDLRSLGEGSEGPEWPRVNAARALRLVMDAAADVAVPEEPEAESVEVLGWLELPLDPSELVVVTGMNEGVIPAAGGGDPLLPDRLREALGIGCDRRRRARDAYVLASIVGSRGGGEQGRGVGGAGRAVFIAGRHSSEGDPRWPSRLLLHGASGAIVSRIRRFLGKEAEAGGRVRLACRIRPGSESRFPVAPRIAARPVEAMSITSFKRYIASPYLFYLQDVLRLEEYEDGDGEIDAQSFGSMIHSVVESFGCSDLRQSTDAQRIAGCLHDHLSALAARRLGPSPGAAARLQLEIARRRLAALALWQAARTREGWLIHVAPEWQPSTGQGVLVVDGAPMPLRGRIDRIERHVDDGRLAILDFKTGDRGARPQQHRRRTGEWLDLQLPLYRHLAAELGAGEDTILGIVSIPQKAEKVGLHMAEWSAEELATADEAAAEVVRGVRAGRFRDEQKDVKAGEAEDGILGALCGAGFIGTIADEEEDEQVQGRS